MYLLALVGPHLRVQQVGFKSNLRVSQVGYGDIVAHSDAERVYAMVAMVLGTSLFG